jgi:hypothetical protein
MPQRVVVLLASWRGHVGNHHNIEVWRMVPLCLMRCIWRKHNTQNFDDYERTEVELKAILFKTLYEWMTAFNSSHFSNIFGFLLCILHVYFRLRPFALSNKITFQKVKRKIHTFYLLLLCS